MACPPGNFRAAQPYLLADDIMKTYGRPKRLEDRVALYPALAVALVLAVFAAGCSSGENRAETRAQNVAQTVPEVSGDVPEDEPAARIAAQVGPSVVQVNVRAVQATPFGGVQEGGGVGSGVIYRRDGYIVTNSHVVQDANEVNIAFADGSEERGEVVGTDPSTEIAVVRVDREDLPAARFAEDANLVPGQLAVAIGSPSGFQSTVTAGIISGLNREIPANVTGGRQEEALVDLIQTDAPISPGNSGGALLNRDGEVVGINVAYLPPESGVESIGFAVPSDTAISVADQLIETGRVSRPFLGINNRDLTPEIAEQFGLPVQRGVIIVQVEPGSPAGRAGLEREDVITALGSTTIEGSGDLLGALRDYRPGDTVTLTVLRGAGGEENIEIELGERPN
jgi:serine protease Do